MVSVVGIPMVHLEKAPSVRWISGNPPRRPQAAFVEPVRCRWPLHGNGEDEAREAGRRGASRARQRRSFPSEEDECKRCGARQERGKDEPLDGLPGQAQPCALDDGHDVRRGKDVAGAAQEGGQDGSWRAGSPEEQRHEVDAQPKRLRASRARHDRPEQAAEGPGDKRAEDETRRDEEGAVGCRGTEQDPCNRDHEHGGERREDGRREELGRQDRAARDVGGAEASEDARFPVAREAGRNGDEPDARDHEREVGAHVRVDLAGAGRVRIGSVAKDFAEDDEKQDGERDREEGHGGLAEEQPEFNEGEGPESARAHGIAPCLTMDRYASSSSPFSLLKSGTSMPRERRALATCWATGPVPSTRTESPSRTIPATWGTCVSHERSVEYGQVKETTARRRDPAMIPLGVSIATTCPSLTMATRSQSRLASSM